jgi:hypothetical protein
MAGLDPAIHDVDPRDKPGDDDRVEMKGQTWKSVRRKFRRF